MTNTNQNKLSNIIARKILAADERSTALALATPVYCPDYNGVKANRVTIINPNKPYLTNKEYTVRTYGDYSLDDTNFTVYNNVDQTLAYLPVINIGPTTYIQYSTSNVKEFNLSCTVKAFDKTSYLMSVGSSTLGIVRLAAGIAWFLNGSNYQIIVPEAEINVGSKLNFRGVQEIDGGVAKMRVYVNGTDKGLFDYNTTVTLEFGGGLKGNNTVETINGDETYVVTNNDETLYLTKNFSDVDKVENNVIEGDTNQDIILNSRFSVSFAVPNEVDLESRIDLMNLIKAEVAAKFKKAVADDIMAEIELGVTQNTLTNSVTMSATLSETFAELLTKYVADGSGQQFSVLKYDNGAPVPYVQSEEQPALDKVVLKRDGEEDGCMIGTFDYASISDTGVPAIHYCCADPTCILPEAQYQTVQEQLIDGTMKEYLLKKMNFDTTEEPLTNIGEGIFGDNSCFAVAFTAPKITRQAHSDLYMDRVNITIFYGVELINNKNLFIIEQA